VDAAALWGTMMIHSCGQAMRRYNRIHRKDWQSHSPHVTFEHTSLSITDPMADP
jgi:hypothetical protein